MIVLLTALLGHAGEPLLVNCHLEPDQPDHSVVVGCGSRTVGVMVGLPRLVRPSLVAARQPIDHPVRESFTLGDHEGVLTVGKARREAAYEEPFALGIVLMESDRMAQCIARFREGEREAQEAWCKTVAAALLEEPSAIRDVSVVDVWSGTWTGSEGGWIKLQVRDARPMFQGTFTARDLPHQFAEELPELPPRISGTGRWFWNGTNLVLAMDQVQDFRVPPLAIMVFADPDGSRVTGTSGEVFTRTAPPTTE